MLTKNITIEKPELFHIKDNRHNEYFGANQIWYEKHWQRQAGCGPTNCSHLIWYLSQTRENCDSLVSHNGFFKDGFLKIMNDVWNHVTPGTMGVNSTDLFCDGARSYGQAMGYSLSCETLNIPSKLKLRPDLDQVEEFLKYNFSNNRPVAFLNLSNGKVSNLDNWHWVTLVGLHSNNMNAIMYDQGLKQDIDLKLWLETTVLGGGFVSLDLQRS